jgi:hypothetical protein
MEKYKISFRKNELNSVKAYLFNSENSVIFLKLYLITKSQLYDIMKINFKIKLDFTEEEFLDLINETNDISNNNTNNNCIINLQNKEYSILKNLGELDNISIFSLINTNDKMPISAPQTDYLRNIFMGLKKGFNPYSEYLIMYYIYRLEGIKNFFDINQLTESFFKISKDGNNNNNSILMNSVSSNTESKFSQENIYNNNINLSDENEHNNINNQNFSCEDASNNIDKDNETVKCSTYHGYPYTETPEKDQLNQYSYIFDLNHLPIFDENNGEFFWTSNEANWKSARDSILRSEELNGKSISLNQGSIVSLSSSFINNEALRNNQNNSKDDDAEKRWNEFKKEGNSNTFVNELSNLLKNFEVDN